MFLCVHMCILRYWKCFNFLWHYREVGEWMFEVGVRGWVNNYQPWPLGLSMPWLFKTLTPRTFELTGLETLLFRRSATGDHLF